jgi:hypothetical protein
MLRAPVDDEDVSLLGFTPDGDIELPEDFEWLDYTIFLLHVAAEIEHSLMVQYLYAAYSLGGPGLSDETREKARVWREVILGIAKEEMAHLITVQNLLRAIGGPIHLEREDYPYRSEFYPFHFRLERLTKDSLAKYVYAEAPENWEVSATSQEIRNRAHAAEGAGINRVGKLYKALDKIFSAPDRILDAQFLATTATYQASRDEWGRGYEHGQRGNQSLQNAPGTPHLFIDRVTNRAEAVAAIRQIAQQGEAPVDDQQSNSHFARFLAIYQQIDEANPPSRAVPRDPTINAVDAGGRTVVSDPSAVRWCQLFDLRYRMLLFRLKHAFFARPGEDTSEPTARGQLIAWTFGEMYNLRAIAGILVQTPLGDGSADNVAGPPFEMPYSISLPDWDSDKWRAHRALIANSNKLTSLMIQSGEAQSDYLLALKNNDALAAQVVDVLLQRALQNEERP